MERLTATEERRRAVWRALDRVTDPELDDPITDMGFVDGIEIAGGSVEVAFRLPTYWCSPNFAYLMAEDIRREVEALPWVEQARVCLQDHMFADKVNEGVNDGTGFDASFGDMASGDDLSALRAKFEVKAFQRRQESVLLHLRAAGCTDAEIAAMTLAAFDLADFGEGEAAAQKPRYREMLLAKGLAREGADLAFRTWEGAPLTPAGMADYLGTLRQVRINMEFNGALCRRLKSTRYKEAELGEDGPGLVDFMLGRVPGQTPPACI
ncbi:iron-sulfur cluster assembly protein [Paralimibaculum aggregatum]|uniref:Iron-sulfur cluster assembly protein n=1 Tax=Paralimibaculum aggregatum TaxID=3036245 RepID=A0ABQ6LQF6_9RHOB|nr:iron-sulfur cluster assembly protein [Limibaculum sp. NKW23]GMG83114.1 iron-sulfur cluster assembly protein [Limibaculum sp. NKW23]